MTLSAFLSSVLSEYAPRVQRADRGADGMHSLPVEQEDLQRCKIYRKSFPMTEIAIPAIVLRNRAVAKWVTDHRVTVDVHSGEDLAVAIAAGVHLSRLTLHADVLSESDLFAAIRLGDRPDCRRLGRADRSAEIRCGATCAGCHREDDRHQLSGVGHGRRGLIVSRSDSGLTAMKRTSRSRRFLTTSGSTWWGCIATSACKITTSSATRRRSVTWSRRWRRYAELTASCSPD